MGGSQGRGRGAARGCRGRRGLAPERIWKEPWEFDVKGGWEQTHKPLSVQSGEALGLLRRRILGGRSSTVWDRVWAECGPDQKREMGRGGDVTGSEDWKRPPRAAGSAHVQVQVALCALGRQEITCYLRYERV